MSKRINLNELIQLNEEIAKKIHIEDEKEKYFRQITSYIDYHFFDTDHLIQKINSYATKSDINIMVLKKTEEVIELNVDDVNNYLSETKRAIEKAVFLNKKVFSQSIFIEIKNIFRYFVEKSFKYESLNDYKTLYTINSMEYHQQCESFKYLYTIFDKITYISKHMDEKYNNNSDMPVSKLSLKFYNDFIPSITFLAKSRLHKEELSEIVKKITTSSAWHFIRRFRNITEHDFVNPASKFNFVFATKVLFIIIGRLILAIDRCILDEKGIGNLVLELKNKL